MHKSTIRAFAFLAVALLLQFTAMPARAMDLNKAFSDLLGSQGSVTVNTPGQYTSQARNTFIAGGLDVRVPASSNVTLLSISPPSLNAGCSGISLFFGGFSFISGPQIEQLISNIAQGATGYVVSLVIKTLCPMCSAIIETMQSLAQQAAKAALNSCQISQQLVTKFLGDPNAGSNGLADRAKNLCTGKVASDGSSSDWLSALDTVCTDAKQAIQYLVGDADSGDAKHQKAGKNKLAAEGIDGNAIWRGLGALIPGDSDDIRQRKLLLMSMMGTTVLSQKNVTSDSSDPAATYPVKITPDQVYDALMCGTRPKAGYASQYCAKAWATSLNGANIYYCADNFDDCKVLTTKPLTGVFTGDGLYQQVHDILHQAVMNVQTNTAQPTKVLQLIETIPLPLYQAINAAAIYPAAADELLSTFSAISAQLVAQQYFTELVKVIGQYSETTGAASTNLPPKLLEKIVTTAEKFQAYGVARVKAINDKITAREMIAGQIQSINRAIQKQVLTTDMLTNNAVANAYGEMIKGAVAGTGASK